MSAEEIKAYATQVKVPFLVHFTRAVNLPSIFERGIYPTAACAEVGIEPHVNDALRLDEHPDATSTSIAFPNSLMFYRYRMEDGASEWAVLALHPSILWTKRCAFCRHNAADARISCQPLENLTTPAAFAGMYEEIANWDSRADQRLKSYDPTDVQAEVLVFDIIEPTLIHGIAFNNSDVKARYEQFAGGRQVLLQGEKKGLFATRGYARQVFLRA